ncbi:MAG TPA: hypothetical protein VG826_26160 [Pirellulales bacterium]|nr:hypothetical protein [Pirellulales bacterium]
MKTRSVVLLERGHDHTESLLLQVKMAGHQPHVCFSADDCVKTVERVKPGVVSFNAGWPLDRVYELGQRLPQLSHRVPLLLRVTQPGDVIDCEFSLQPGIRFHLSKPVNSSILHRILQNGSDRCLA